MRSGYHARRVPMITHQFRIIFPPIPRDRENLFSDILRVLGFGDKGSNLHGQSTRHPIAVLLIGISKNL